MATPTAFTLSPDERATMRRALLKANHSTRGLDDEQIYNLHAQLVTAGNLVPGSAEPDPPRQRAEPTPAPAPDASLGILEAAIKASVNAALRDLDAQSVDEQQIVDLIEKHTTKTINIEVKQPNGDTVTIPGAHPMLADTLTVFECQENVLLTGPAGSGKTTMAQQAAKVLATAFHSTGAVIDKFELLGFVDAGGKYHSTPLREAVEHGGVFLWDEVDSSYPAPLNAFNAMLENRFITFPDGAHFDIDPAKTMFIAAANTLGLGANRTYVGRYELDRAFLDRFSQLEVEIDESIEKSMAVNSWVEFGGDKEKTHIAHAWAREVQKFRALLAERKILALCTTRATRRGAKYLAKGWSMDKVKGIELFKHLTHDQRKQLGV